MRHLGGWYRELSQVLYSQSRGGMGSGEVTSQVSPEIPVSTSSRPGFLPREKSAQKSKGGNLICSISEQTSPETSLKQPFFIPVLSHQLLPEPSPVISQLGMAISLGWDKALYLLKISLICYQQWALTSSHSVSKCPREEQLGLMEC